MTSSSCFWRVQAVEIRPAVDAEQHGLAIDHEGGVAVTERGLGDQREAIAPVVAIAGEQPHAPAVALDDQSISVVLNLVDQSFPAGTVVPRVGMQGSNGDLSMPVR